MFGRGAFIAIILFSTLAWGQQRTVSPEDQALIEEFMKEGEFFSSQTQEARDISQRVLSEAFKRREKDINDRYEAEILGAENEQRRIRAEAIAKFEAFLKKSSFFQKKSHFHFVA